MRTNSLARLQRLDDALRGNGGGELADIGLVLHRKIARAPYQCTPRNSVSFASTGGDGVHFGFLVLDDRDRDVEASPIVMTVPTCFERPNVVVGRDLIEFLSLGCRHGFSALEGLAYARRAETIARYDLAEPMGARYFEPLAALTSTFALRPWPNVEARLADLERDIAGRLDVRPNPPIEMVGFDDRSEL